MPESVRSTGLARVSRGLSGLTDDVLTLAPRTDSIRAYVRDGIDQLAGADPGQTQLRLALQAVLGIGAGVGLAYAFVRLTGALQLPPNAGPPAVVQAGDHALLIVAMLISALVAMMAGSVVSDTTPRAQIVTTLLLPIPMLGTMTIGIALGPYRIASLAWLVVLLAAAVYVRRFGPRGVAVGLVMFNGGFLGFFLHAQIGLRDVGWLAALLGLGVVASLTVRFTLFRTDLLRTLAGMRRSWEGRANHTLVLSAAVLEASDADDRKRASERLRRQLVRLNESTLMVDAQLVESVPDSADIEAQRCSTPILRCRTLRASPTRSPDAAPIPRCGRTPWRVSRRRCAMTSTRSTSWRRTCIGPYATRSASPWLLIAWPIRRGPTSRPAGSSAP